MSPASQAPARPAANAMRARRAFRVLGLLLAVAAAPAMPVHAQETKPLGVFLSMITKSTSAQCTEAKRKLARSGSKDPLDEDRMIVELNCNCFPQALEKSTAPLGGIASQRRVTQDEAVSVVKTAIYACAARAVRKQLPAACMQDDEVPPAERQAYCGCMSRMLQEAGDVELAEGALEASRNADAERSGDPTPRPVPDVVERIEKACGAAPSGGANPAPAAEPASGAVRARP